MVVDLSFYKLLVPPHYTTELPEWRKRFTNADTLGRSFQWATNVKSVCGKINNNLTSFLSAGSWVAAAYNYRDKLAFWRDNVFGLGVLMEKKGEILSRSTRKRNRQI
jgi:hypothetical protein